MEMINRSSLFLLPILAIIIAIYVFLARPSVCLDSAGCILIGANDPIQIGIGVVTIGSDRSLSIELQQGMDLFASNLASQPVDHKLFIRTYFSSCLPDVSVQSTVDLAADRHILAVIGPTCGENSADFSKRIADANKIAISPIPYRSVSNEASISIHPDSSQLAAQTSDWIHRLGYTQIIVLHDTDEQSSTFSTHLCEYFRATGICEVDVDGTTNFDPGNYNAAVEVFLNDSNPPNPDTILSSSSLPQVIVSFSRPVIPLNLTATYYWIGPQFWNDNQGYVETFLTAYGSYPTSFASGVLYSHMSTIYNEVRETAVVVWDGSWMIPMSKLKRQIDAAFINDPYFCSSSGSNCSVFPLAGYQVVENKYKLVNP